jgi:hypothetical protein
MTQCKRSTLKKYTERGSPPYPANDCQGQKKRGNDGKQYISRPDSRGVYRWVAAEGAAKTRKAKPGQKRYKIHDNRGVPFLVDVGKTAVTVWKQNYNLKTESYDPATELMTIPYSKLWLGDDHLGFGPDWEKHEKGNSILLRKPGDAYVYIGSEIREFRAAAGDKIVDYNSYIGNNDVPYPFAVGETHTYLLIEKVYLPNGAFDMKEDPYTQYYGFTDAAKGEYLKKVAKKLGGRVLQKRLY